MWIACTWSKAPKLISKKLYSRSHLPRPKCVPSKTTLFTLLSEWREKGKTSITSMFLLISMTVFLMPHGVHTETCNRDVSAAATKFLIKKECLQWLGANHRWWQKTNDGKRLIILAVWSIFQQSRKAYCFVPISEKRKCVVLIKCIWLGCVSVTNRDAPSCLKIIRVISKSLFLPVCRQFPVFVVCRISLPLAAYYLISGRAH